MAWTIQHLCFVLIPAIIFLLIHFRVIRFYRSDVAIHCAADGKEIEVPHVIHQIWKASLTPESYPLNRCSWKLMYPEWDYNLWKDSSNRLLVKDHFPWFLQTYDNLPHDMCRVDTARYIYLYLYGGVYADLDTECVRPFTHLLNHSIVLGAMQGKSLMKEGHVENSLMFSVPRHPFWLEMLRYIADTEHDKALPEKIAGSAALMTVLKKHRAACPQDVFIYPPKYFNPFSWMNNDVKACKSHGKMTKEDYIECKKTHTGAYVIRYHTHLWDVIHKP